MPSWTDDASRGLFQPH